MNTELSIDVPINTKDLAALASKAFHEQMIEAFVFKSCINCENYDEKYQICNLYNSKPPAKTIVYSCGDAWVQDIPF